MTLKNYPDDKLLTELEVLRTIQQHLADKKPFSLVRLGDAENIIMGQGVFFSNEELLKLKWLNDPQYKTGERGVSLPNLVQRDQTVAAVRMASLIGICRNKHDDLIAADELKRPLSNKIFDHYQIEPPSLCHVFINRKMVAKKLFWVLLHQYRTLLVSRWATLYRDLMKRDYYNFRPRIVGCVDITNYTQISEVLESIGQYEFDLALVSAGTSAVILIPEIAQRFGKVALDYGHVMAFTLTKDPRVTPWHPPKAKKKAPAQPATPNRTRNKAKEKPKRNSGTIPNKYQPKSRLPREKTPYVQIAIKKKTSGVRCSVQKSSPKSRG